VWCLSFRLRVTHRCSCPKLKRVCIIKWKQFVLFQEHIKRDFYCPARTTGAPVVRQNIRRTTNLTWQAWACPRRYYNIKSLASGSGMEVTVVKQLFRTVLCSMFVACLSCTYSLDILFSWGCMQRQTKFCIKNTSSCVYCTRMEFVIARIVSW